MFWIKILILFTSIPAVYLVYHRYLIFKPEIRKHAEAFTAGVCAALIILLLAPLISGIFPSGNILLHSFIKAALIEKILCLVFMLIIFRHYTNFCAAEAMLASMIFGLAFAFAENIHFALSYGSEILLPRTVFSLPFHITSCGILGFYLGRRTLSSTSGVKLFNIAKGMALSVALHGLFDYLILKGKPYSFGAAPLLVISVAMQEIYLSRSIIIPALSVLKGMEIRYEQWKLIYDQSRYDRWIQRSMGRRGIVNNKLFIWEPGVIKLLAVMGLITAGAMGFGYREEISSSLEITLSSADEIMVYGLFPLSAAVILIISGAVNTDFFRTNEMRIPVISDAHLVFDGKDETFVSYSISHNGCFVKSYEPLGNGKRITLLISYGTRIPVLVKARVIWENHTSRQYPAGSILRFEKHDGTLNTFIFRYAMLRFFKGISFNLKLPGFETTKRLFVHPVSAMQEDIVYPEKSLIFNEGDDARQFYLLKKGNISFKKKKETGEEIWLGGIEPGEIFGEMAVIPGRKRASNAVCDTECIIAVSDREKLYDLIRYNPEFALSLIQMLAERAENSEKILLEYIALIERQDSKKGSCS